MDEPNPARRGAPASPGFLAGVFFITFAVMVFQVVQTRILSVIAWYYLAFFAISVAMLGMTVGAVWVYLHAERTAPERIARLLSDCALLTAVAMPASLLIQLSLVTSLSLSLVVVVAWALLLAAMTLPYVFAGVAVSLALTRSPVPVNQVYAVDLVGAALGCVGVVVALDWIDAPSTIVLAGAIAAVSAWSFARGAPGAATPPWYRRPGVVAVALAGLAAANSLSPIGIRPVLVKDLVERFSSGQYERWNSYSRVLATAPRVMPPTLWAPSPRHVFDRPIEQVGLNIDGLAGTKMQRFDGNLETLDFLRYDLVNLAYNLPGIHKAGIIGVGGGRDVLSAHLFGVEEIVGVELNPIFIDLHTKVPFYRDFSNLKSLPNLRLYVDDARSWYASTPETFDLIQMSMIDTWAATGAGAFTLSENGLYTLEGWRAFLNRLNDGGVFTVSRWYGEGDVNETGRMISLATAALLDDGVTDARPHLFVARADRIATLVLSKRPFTAAQVALLRGVVDKQGFEVLLAPDQPPQSELLAAIVASPDARSLDRAVSGAFLDLSPPTDDRPFFFNQLRIGSVFGLLARARSYSGQGGLVAGGVATGNLLATGALLLVLALSIAAVILTVLLPLRNAARRGAPALVAAGSLYFGLIGMGFMFAEIALLQYFSVYLGHPIYSLGVCLFSLILSSGLGSLASGRLMSGRAGAMTVWALLVAAALFAAQHWLGDVFNATTDRTLAVRIAIALAVVMPIGFLLGFAFPTGMRLVEAVDPEPTPWFWGINGAAGVLASVLAVILSMSFGIRFTLLGAAACYLCLIPTSRVLIGLGQTAPQPAREQPAQNGIG